MKINDVTNLHSITSYNKQNFGTSNESYSRSISQKKRKLCFETHNMSRHTLFMKRIEREEEIEISFLTFLWHCQVVSVRRIFDAQSMKQSLFSIQKLLKVCGGVIETENSLVGNCYPFSAIKDLASSKINCFSDDDTRPTFQLNTN